jgi:hypothetical protein
MPLIFKDWRMDLYAKIGHATMVDGKLQSRAIRRSDAARLLRCCEQFNMTSA